MFHSVTQEVTVSDFCQMGVGEIHFQRIFYLEAVFFAQIQTGLSHY